MSPQPRYSNPAQQRFLEDIARGKCSAVSRGSGAVSRYFPTVNGEIVTVLGAPEEGFACYGDAKNAAIRYRESCREALAQANGDL